MSLERPRSSPWGHVDQSEQLAPGIYWVSTPSHGGLMISWRFLRDRLSQAAADKGDMYDGGPQHLYKCYEEDSHYAVALYEMQDLWPAMWPSESGKAVDARLYKLLSRWHPDYLRQRGIEPLSEEEAQWRELQQALIDNKKKGLRSQ